VTFEESERNPQIVSLLNQLGARSSQGRKGGLASSHLARSPSNLPAPGSVIPNGWGWIPRFYMRGHKIHRQRDKSRITGLQAAPGGEQLRLKVYRLTAQSHFARLPEEDESSDEAVGGDSPRKALRRQVRTWTGHYESALAQILTGFGTGHARQRCGHPRRIKFSF